MKAFASVVVPRAVVTVTLFSPPELAAVLAVTVNGFTTVTFVAGIPPMVTEVVESRYSPDSVMFVPPLVGPLIGETDANLTSTIGAFTTRKPRLALTANSGLAELRLDERRAEAALLNAPPRVARSLPLMGPSGSVDGLDP